MSADQVYVAPFVLGAILIAVSFAVIDERVEYWLRASAVISYIVGAGVWLIVAAGAA